MACGAGGVNQPPAVVSPDRAPVDVAIVSELIFALDADDFAGVVEGQVGDEQLQQAVAMAIGAIADALAIGREERSAIIAFGLNDPGFLFGLEIGDEQVALARFERAIQKETAIVAE